MKIHICNRSRARKLSYKLRDAPIISISDPTSKKPHFNGYNTRPVLRLRFWDNDTPGKENPNKEHIDQIISFANSLYWPENEGDLIIHCEAGICRSSAAACIVLAVREGCEVIKDRLTEYGGDILPNMLMIRICDDSLGLGGELISAGLHFDRLWVEKNLLKANDSDFPLFNDVLKEQKI